MNNNAEEPSVTKPERPQITIFSFGFKHGLPLEANMLFDVRFLPNPYWQEELRPMSGRDRAVSDYVIGSPEGSRFLELLRPLLDFVVEQAAGTKKEFRIAIGCTGGRHRSVAVAEALKGTIPENQAFELEVFHRDIDRNGQGGMSRA